MFGALRFAATLQRLYPFWLDKEKIKAKQEKRLRALLAHAVAHSPYYRRRLSGIDITRCAIENLPILTKAEMMEHYDELVTDPRLKKAELSAFVDDLSNLGKLYLGRYGVSHTSGSQGQPALIVQDQDALALVFAVQFARATKLKRRLLPHLGRLFKPARMAVFTIKPGFYPSAAAFAYLPRFLAPAFKVLRLSHSDPVSHNARLLESFRPDYITGYASALEALGREEASGRMNLSALGCLKQITNVAEPMTDDAAAELERIFGVHVADEYAMGECMVLTSGCIAGRGSHVNADLAILEVVDADNRPVPPGVEGSKVLVTNLYNHVQPIIRYEVDDRVTMSAEPCPCGSPLPHVASIAGRTKDKLWVEENGERREVPYYIFLAPLHHVLDLAEHQIVQTGPRHFVVRLVPLPGRTLSTDRIRSMLIEHVRTEGLDSMIDIEIEVVSELPRGPSGKFSRVRNDYALKRDAAGKAPPSAEAPSEKAPSA
ncbi:phenylacetate--CoA ligase family protein [Hyphomicrobium sp. CS1GBMeth3]|uniref:phenylacetate--CoA ligase family protein n=1 Tax=Hyphomicrobium sp. CS1GBMeth3 TaxID=1892845 RepID=UPI000931EA0A|nr:phenylacetate--CoA ligase family protein [Hyphomicrobium sp. CS1GBMeth3]